MDASDISLIYIILAFSVIFIFYTGCNNTRFYGGNCDNPCPANCINNTCHIQSGACISCQPGWTGIHCNTSKKTNISLCQIKIIVNCFVILLWLGLGLSLNLYLNTLKGNIFKGCAHKF